MRIPPRGTRTSVGEPKSADGLQVLVSGRAVPVLLRTGEEGPGPGVGPGEGSGKQGAGRRVPRFCTRAQAVLQLWKTS